MRDCVICKHAHRVEIEAALFKVSPDNAESDKQIRCCLENFLQGEISNGQIERGSSQRVN